MKQNSLGVNRINYRIICRVLKEKAYVQKLPSLACNILKSGYLSLRLKYMGLKLQKISKKVVSLNLECVNTDLISSLIYNNKLF